jgi:hypothetical protein
VTASSDYGPRLLMLPRRRLAPSPRALAFFLAPALAIVSNKAWAEDATVTVRELDPKTGAAIKVEEKSLTYLSLGPTISYVDAANTPPAYAIGLEGSLNHYGAERIMAFGYGAFAQLQLVDGKYARGALGGQINAGPVGLELGLGARQTDGTYDSTVSFHGALFISVGYLFIAYVFSPELFSFKTGASQDQGFGLESAFTLGIKVPIAVQGRDPTGFAVQANGHAW